MKKIALTIQLCALLFTVYGQEQAFSISGDIELDKGQLLVLTQRPGKTDTLARTAIVGQKIRHPWYSGRGSGGTSRD